MQPSLLLCKYVHSVRRPTAGPADQVLWEAKQVWQNMLFLYVLSYIMVRIIPIDTWYFVMGIDYYNNSSTSTQQYQTSHADNTINKQHVQPSLLLSKYVNSVRRPTADPANQVLWEAKQVWQNMLLLHVFVSSCA